MTKGLERREFLRVLGVSGAGASLVGCGTGPADKLIPYVIPHEDIVPGIATWYRTTCGECPAGCGMEVRTREGRAVKAEGNPLSPVSHGKLCSRGHASLHGLYDPDRVPQALARDGDTWEKLAWDEAEGRLADALSLNRGRAVLLTEGTSGSLDALLDEFSTAFGIERVRYEPFALEPIRAANRLVFGVDAIPVHDFSHADVVLTFGADFLETWGSPIDQTHGWVQAHAYDAGRRGRLVSVAPHQSLTDMNADEWLAIRPGTEHLVALALARLVADAGGSAGDASTLLAAVDVEASAAAAEVAVEKLREIAREFANGGRSLAVGPGIANQHNRATTVAAAVAVLNAVAGNYGHTVHLGRQERTGPTGTYADLRRLVTRMAAGQVGALLVHGPNPLYTLPATDGVAEALERVPFIASFSSFLDETSARAHLLLPDHHFLEAWGDSAPRTGLLALTQPVMTPVFATKQTGDVLLSAARRAGTELGAGAATFYDYLRQRWAREVHGTIAPATAFDDWWREILQVGFVAQSVEVGAAPVMSAEGLAGLDLSEPSFDGEAADPLLVVYPSYRFYDGRMANRPWLQEMPDPISKFCWSSWVEINEGLAEEMGLDTGHIVEISTRHSRESGITIPPLPVWRHPGTRRDVIAIQLGQGHEGMGSYAADRGVNPVRLLQGVADDASGAFAYLQARASVAPTGDWERPIQAGLQNEQHDREIARAYSLEEARTADAGRGFLVLGGTGAAVAEETHEEEGHGDVHPQDAKVTVLQDAAGWAPVEVEGTPQSFPPPGTHYGPYTETQPRWAMAIDLDRCTGCSACMTACHAENNIGIVGPDLVRKGRILHWIRLERYFEGEGEHLQTRFLPMLCQHCNNAPCEPVCPVYASYHTPDGLNAQVYNRCVGTRYCANNCPYKLRVFNYYSYEWPEPLNWQLNPDVTVREKGIMEKCTFCVQRIRDAENRARLEDRGVRDGEIVPACQQTCPADAIVFGNIKDPESRVARAAASGRGYRVLEELNTQPAITYLRKVVPEAPEG